MEPQSHETKQESLPQESQSWQPDDWQEGRRLRAYELAQQGWKQCRIAEALGVTEGAVSQWLARARDEGVEALKTRKGTSAPPKVTKEQKATLPDLLLKGAMTYGFAGDVWTAERVAAVIEKEWHVKYHSHYVTQLLHDCGWSYQKQVLQATHCNEVAITKWREQKMPALKKEVARSKKAP